MADKEDFDTRIRRALGLPTYKSWPEMPSSLLVVFLGLFSAMGALCQYFFVVAWPDLAGVFHGLAAVYRESGVPGLWHLPARLAVGLVVIGIDVLAIALIGAVSPFMVKGLLGILERRYFGGPGRPA